MQLFFHMDLTVDPLTTVPTGHSGDNSNPYQLPYKLSTDGKTRSSSTNFTPQNPPVIQDLHRGFCPHGKGKY